LDAAEGLPLKKRNVGPRILFIPDTQVKPDVPTDHIAWAARYAADKRPDAIVCAGDWYDMPSLSSYDAGRLAAEGRRYQDDIDAGSAALALFDRELRKHAPRSYRPRKVVTLGNHEERIKRAVEESPKMEGKVSMNDLAFQQYGWVVHSFLEVATVFGVAFTHFCTLNAQGRAANTKHGAPSARAQAIRMMRSTVCGHRQGLDVATVEAAGRRVRGVIAGSFYRHIEGYMGPQGNSHWQGLLMLNDIQAGDFDLCEVSMSYLSRRWG
jgi:hypothetical protein